MAEFIDIEDLFRTELEDFLEEFKDEQLEIFDRERMNASGDTRRTFEVKMEQNRGLLLGPEHLDALEQGRGPSNKTGPGRPLIERIKQWISDKSIVPTDITIDSLAFLITRKIHREGTKRHRDNKRTGIRDKVLAPKRIELFLKEMTELLGTTVLNNFQQRAK